MARVTLTKKKAQGLFRAREAAGKSQYEVAEELGWVRSKVKRIEKAETKTILEEDLRLLEECLNVRESPAKKVLKKVPLEEEEGTLLPMFKEGILFSKTRYLPERSFGNQVFFEVKMATTTMAEQLLRVRQIKIGGVSGSINGVENARNQRPIKAGAWVVIMLWGPGLHSVMEPLSKPRSRPGVRRSHR